MKKYYVLTFLILANLFWAGNYVFGKFVVAEMAPLQMTFLRWLIAIFLLFPIAHIIERPNWKIVWKQWKTLSVMAVLGIAGYNFLLYEALRFTTPMNASLVNSINPAIIVLFSSLLLKERISLKNGAGLLISLLGVLLVLTHGHLEQIFHLHFNRGDLLMLLAILVWTFYSIIGRTIKEAPPISATAVSVMLGLLMLLPFVLSSGLEFPESRQAIAGMLYIGIFPSVGSFVFWNVALRQIGPSRAGIFLNLIAVFTAILSLLLGNSITLVQILGGILVFIGVYLTSQLKKKETLHISPGSKEISP
ncbi:DMT family transporter [Peribacillus glennii]|uniref:DMT family transporter n=1 Tax=Peribacillus glennii TaxID=2303991 RepID=A0A372LA10_9BACI|nr:DMT family transporter [Peribacillus glennii]RFU62448.1 DMT family transporter [Peribacillus glennii]